jgi:hypothetical protein
MQSLSELRKLVEKQRQSFLNPKLFEHVIILLSVYRFRPKARKFIYNLFEDLVFKDEVSVDYYHDY